MPYDITLATQQFSTGPESQARVNDWIFDPASPLNVTYVIAGSTPTAIDIDTLIKNYLEVLESPPYSNIRVFATIVFSTSVQWFALSGEIATAGGSGYLLGAPEDLEVTNTITFQNLSLLEIGEYSATITFSVTADTTHSTGAEFIEQVVYPINLSVIDGNTINANPETLNYSFLRDDALPATQEVNIVTDSTWTITTAKEVAITGTGLTDLSTATQTIIQGTGDKTINVGFAAILNDVVGQSFSAELAITNSEGFSDTVQVYVNIFDSATFIFEPPSLSFFAIQNLEEATPLDFNVFGFGAFTLASPSWLTLSNASGTDTGVFTATPFLSSSMTPGVYQGNIVLTDDNDPANEYELPVTYIVAGTIYTDLDDGNFNFTKEIEYLNIYNVNEGAFPEVNNVAKLILNIKVYNYVTFSEEELQFDYFLPFNNSRTKIHLGEIIERTLKKIAETTDVGITDLNTVFQSILPVYKPALVSADIEIINRSDDEVVFSETVENMKFVAGLKPKQFANNSGILSHDFNAKRVTPTSIEIINMLVNTAFYTISIKKNDEDYTEISTQSRGTNNIFRYVFDFSAYAPGDVVTFKLTTGADEFTKTYQVMPEGKHSNHIAFMGQYRTLELLEFTGDWELMSDHKKETSEYYRDLVRVLEQTETNKDVFLKINTGFILRKNQTLVDEIIRSSKAWLMFPDKSAVELLPMGKKIVNYDSDAELYNYELEFKINRINDFENFTF